MALQRHEVADSQHRRPDETKRLSRCRPVVWAKKREVDPIAQYLNPFGADAELDEPLPQPARNRHQTIGMLCCPADPLPRNHMPRDDIEVATSGGDDNRAPEDAPEQDCSRPVRVEIVRVDQVEIATV